MFEPAEFVERAVRSLRENVSGSAMVACSGGVDSTVCAGLARRALGDRFTAVFVDDGMRREGEPERVTMLLKSLGMRSMSVDAKERFFRSLAGIEDAEEKRKAFRNTFYSVLADVAKALRTDCLIQGTIAADVVETVGGVKTQHNVLEQIGLSPSKYGLRVLEPLRELYKHEVREVARQLKLPEEVCRAMPFPGPGLAIRVVGEVTPERVKAVRAATRIVEEETRGIDAFQTFAVLIPVNATGVKDGGRTYGSVIVIRSVDSTDALKASASEIPMQDLRRIAKRIVNEVDGVSRCAYDITDKPPATIEYE